MGVFGCLQGVWEAGVLRRGWICTILVATFKAFKAVTGEPHEKPVSLNQLHPVPCLGWPLGYLIFSELVSEGPYILIFFKGSKGQPSCSLTKTCKLLSVAQVHVRGVVLPRTSMAPQSTEAAQGKGKSCWFRFSPYTLTIPRTGGHARVAYGHIRDRYCVWVCGLGL